MEGFDWGNKGRKENLWKFKRVTVVVVVQLCGLLLDPSIVNCTEMNEWYSRELRWAGQVTNHHHHILRLCEIKLFASCGFTLIK